MPTWTTSTPTPTIPTQTQTTRTRSASPRAEEALRRAIEPAEPVRFLAETWERAPLHVPRAEEGRWDGLLSWRDAERMVTEPGLRHPAFRLVKAGEQIPTSAYTESIPWRPVPFTGTADVRRVAEEFERGATIVLQGLHHSRVPIAQYCRELEEAIGHPTQANAYMTPRRSQGLPVHHDTHEVFVLQVAGRKRWLVYEPAFDLPLKHQRYTAGMGSPGEPVLDIGLEPGDTLYLPRGWLHEALTSDEDSLHLTVGVNVVTWLDAFRAALERLEDDLEFRRSLPADGAGADGLIDRLAERLAPEEVSAAARARRLAARRPVLDGVLTDLRALDHLGADTLLERRATVLFEASEDRDGAVTLSYEGRSVRLPPQARVEVLAIASSTKPFTAAELPGRLDEPGRLVLARRLVREGFLRLAR